MDDRNWLVERFEENRGHLRGVAYRMLGSLPEAEDAVQEAWLRLSRSDASVIDNLGGWLTSVVSRVCLDMLRSRRARREEELDASIAAATVARGEGADPEGEAALADATGVALLVLLDTLTPAERLAFVLHDLFALPFEEIATILQRSPAAAKQLASRARRRVRGAPAGDAQRGRHRAIVEAFLAATRTGNLDALLEVLDPDAVIHIDAAARLNDPHVTEPGTPREIRGAALWARQFIAMSRSMKTAAQPALIDGALGVVIAPNGKLSRIMVFTVENDRVTRLDVIGEPERLRGFQFAVED